jgi:hypothetical protein
MKNCLLVAVVAILTFSGCTQYPEPTGNEDLSGLSVVVYWADW